MVGARGFEPPTSCSQSKRATRLRYAPRNGAGGENRTHVISLEGWSNTIIRHPRITLPEV